MDHLQKVRDIAAEPVEVPFLCLRSSPCQLDGQGWHGYPQRIAWSEDSWESFLHLSPELTQNGAKTSTQINSFLQAWLYFELLAEIFGAVYYNPYPMALLRTSDGGKVILCTDILPDLCEKALGSNPESREIDRDARIKHAKYVLYAAMTWINNSIEFKDQDFQERHNIDQSVILSIHVLYQMLASYLGMGGAASLAAPLIFKLKADRWCPADIAWISNHMTVSTGYYYSLFGPRSPNLDHKNCSEMECTAINIDELKYEIKHLSSCSGCSYVNSDVKSAVAALENESFPIFCFEGRLHDESFAGYQKAYQPGDVFVAVSHVWRDGLGNPEDNALPSCRAYEIQRAAELHVAALPTGNVTGQVHIWIDTLCVPISNSSARKIAIIRMRETYEKAFMVLVFDEELQRRYVKPIYQELEYYGQLKNEEVRNNSPILEGNNGYQHSNAITPVIKNNGHQAMVQLCAMITLSNWRRRLWTFQESVLSNNLVFVFHDVSIEFDSMWNWHFTTHYLRSIDRAFESPKTIVEEEVFGNYSLGIGQGLRREVVSWSTVNRSNWERNVGQDAIYDVYIGAQERHTSHSRDTYVCLSILCGFNEKQMRDVLAAQDEDRFSVFLWHQKYFPASVIFADGLKMPQQGLRWCPDPFISRLAYPKLADHSISFNRIGTKTRDGLLVKLFGICFKGVIVGDKWEIIILNGLINDKKYMVIGQNMHLQTRRDLDLDLGVHNGQTCFGRQPISGLNVVMRTAGIQDLAVIMRSELKSEMKAGLLVRVFNQRNGIKYVRSWQKVAVIAGAPSQDSGRNTDIYTHCELGAVGEFLWCVD